MLFLLFDSVTLALFVCGATLAAIQLCYGYFGSRLPTVYLVNVLAVGSLFAHGEVLIRYRFSDYVIEDLYYIHDGYFFNRPTLRSRITGKEYAADYLTNLDGFRIGYSQQTSVTYHKVDWLFLGDSYTQGAQVQFEQLYTTLLYRMFPDRTVANAGISGFGIPEEYEYFVHDGRALNPRIVFLQVSNFNDFMKVQRKTEALSDYIVQYSSFARFLLQGIKYQNPAALPLGRWTEPFYPDLKSNRLFNVFYTETSPEKERDLAAYGQYLRLLRDSVKAAGGELVLVQLPTKEQVRPRYLEEVVRSFHLDVAKLDMARPDALLKGLADSLQIALIDLLEPFQWAAQEPYFQYDEHLTPYGHELLAEVLATWLRQRGETSSTQILSSSYEGARYPVFSPAGDRILYQSPTDGNMELYLGDTALASARRLTYDDVDESHATFSPSGDRIAYTEGSQDSGTTKVVIAGLDGSARLTLPPEAGAYGAIPAFSPDGRRIAYARWRRSGNTRDLGPSQIVIADLLSGETKAITAPAADAWRPVFSHTGDSLVYIAKVGRQFDLFLYDLHSGATRRLTRTSYDEWDPQFSHSGGDIVYAAMADGNWDLFKMNLRSGRNERLTSTLGNEWDPSFAPDDRSIVYGGEYGIFRGIYRRQLAHGR